MKKQKIISVLIILLFILLGLIIYSKAVNADPEIIDDEKTFLRMSASLSKLKDTNNQLNKTLIAEELNKYLGSGKTTVTESSGITNVTYDATGNEYAINDNLEYTITYDANGGTGTLANQTKRFGHRIKLHSTEPTRNGYTFLGWSTNSSATTPEYRPGSQYMANENATLYAVWEEVETVFYENGTFSNGITTWALGSEQRGTVTLEANNIYINNYVVVYSNDRWGWSYSDNKVDLTDFTTLYFEVDLKMVSPATNSAFGVCSEKNYSREGSASSMIKYTSLQQGVTTYEIDVSSLSGSYYLAYFGHPWATGGYSGNVEKDEFNITKIYAK